MKNKRKIFTVITAVIVGLLHFVTGPHYKGPFRNFVNGYLIDILLPFSLYYLFTLIPQLKHKILVAFLVFDIGLTVEILQYFGYEIFGKTFDPLDILMYALGAFCAYFFDIYCISKLEVKTK